MESTSHGMMPAGSGRSLAGTEPVLSSGCCAALWQAASADVEEWRDRFPGEIPVDLPPLE